MKIIITETLKERLPVGKHLVEIVKVDKGTNANGLEYFECFFENKQGVSTDRFYTTEKAMFRIVSLFKSCQLSAETNQEVDTDDLIGKQLEIEIVSRVRDGITFTTAAGFNPIPLGTKNIEEELNNSFEHDDLPF
jgi:hypothetical protein